MDLISSADVIHPTPSSSSSCMISPPPPLKNRDDCCWVEVSSVVLLVGNNEDVPVGDDDSSSSTRSTTFLTGGFGFISPLYFRNELYLSPDFDSGCKFFCFSSSVIKTDAFFLWGLSPPSFSSSLPVSLLSAAAANVSSFFARISSSSPSYGTVMVAERLGNSICSSSSRVFVAFSLSSSEASSNCPPPLPLPLPLPSLSFSLLVSFMGARERLNAGDFVNVVAVTEAAVGFTRVAQDFLTGGVAVAPTSADSGTGVGAPTAIDSCCSTSTELSSPPPSSSSSSLSSLSSSSSLSSTSS
mmetsp:Transcript_20028/g.43560  ORF Transcript_20028/g.43560 Transcript_20028/m.43560 type:complete len:299 (-) Transcript_20028:837-1733(-)